MFPRRGALRSWRQTSASLQFRSVHGDMSSAIAIKGVILLLTLFALASSLVVWDLRFPIATVDTPERVITEEKMKRVYQIESHVERKRGIVNVEALRSCTADPALAEQLRGLFPG